MLKREEETLKGCVWTGWGVHGLDGLVGEDWAGVGVVEITGQRRVGKSVGPAGRLI